MIRTAISVLAAAVLMGLSAGCLDQSPSSQTASRGTDSISVAPPDEPAFAIRSVTLDARHPPEGDVLVELRDLGVTHVTLVPFGWQESVANATVRTDTAGGWYSESHRGIRALARQADTLDLGVILKPHVWVGGYDEEADRSDLTFDSASAWDRWAASYRRFLMTYAQLATDVEADILVVGTELRSVAVEHPDYWRELVRDVRSVYGGDLTYAANWHEEYQRIAFWDALDYVGIQAYFPLSEGSDRSLDTLRARWRSHRAAVAKVHRRTGKPVLFTEVGYRSARTTAEAPWRWPERGNEGVAADSLLQARCYRAFLSTMDAVPWFSGGIIWKWHPNGHRSDPTAFTPQGKPAEAVLRRWFRGANGDSVRTSSSVRRRSRE